MIEGCLSIPRVVVDVERPVFARVSGQDQSGEPVLIEASGHEARVLQHEIDHLNGVLILDRTDRSERRGALKALRRGESYPPPHRKTEEPKSRGAPSSVPPTSPRRSCGSWQPRITDPIWS